MSERPTIVGALRAFLPQFQTAEPALSPQQRRAIWAITHCRTAALGGRAFVCTTCHQVHFAYHSCNHKACPQCGALATRRWVAREVHKLINAPYFLVTFTLPAELRGCFFGPFAKLAYDLFFTAVAGRPERKTRRRQRLTRGHQRLYRRPAHLEPTPGVPSPHSLPGARRRAQCQPATVCPGQEPTSSWSICLTCKPPFASTSTAIQGTRLASRSGSLEQAVGSAHPTGWLRSCRP